MTAPTTDAAKTNWTLINDATIGATMKDAGSKLNEMNAFRDATRASEPGATALCMAVVTVT